MDKLEIIERLKNIAGRFMRMLPVKRTGLKATPRTMGRYTSAITVVSCGGSMKVARKKTKHTTAQSVVLKWCRKEKQNDNNVSGGVNCRDNRMEYANGA